MGKAKRLRKARQQRRGTSRTRKMLGDDLLQWRRRNSRLIRVYACRLLDYGLAVGYRVGTQHAANAMTLLPSEKLEPFMAETLGEAISKEAEAEAAVNKVVGDG